jgi:hypothetical protein
MYNRSWMKLFYWVSLILATKSFFAHLLDNFLLRMKVSTKHNIPQGVYHFTLRIFLASILFCCFSSHASAQQTKILFDATKAEMAGNADWVIDADTLNIGFVSGVPTTGQGSESNPQRYPTPDQSTVTSSTAETYWSGGLSAWGIDCVKKGYTV